MEKTDVIIVGGGLNGATMALAAAQAGLKVTVVDTLPVDTRKRRNFDGRSYALALGSIRFLRSLGVWKSVEAKAQPMLEIKVTDGRAGEGPSPWMLHFDHHEIEEGPMGFMVEDRHLRRALLDAMAEEPRIRHLASETVVSQEVETFANVMLKSGQTLTADLVIGADGRNSGTGQRAGIKRTGWGYNQIALVCAVEHELPHKGIAHQFFMPGGPLAILPLTENRSSIVWSENADKAKAAADLSDEDFLAVLRPAFGSFLGDLKLVGDRFTYPLGLSLANSFVADRVALVGDAAHGDRIECAVGLAEVDNLAVHACVATVGNDRLGLLWLPIGVPHGSAVANDHRHGCVDDDVAGDVQVRDASIGIDHRHAGTGGVRGIDVGLDLRPLVFG